MPKLKLLSLQDLLPHIKELPTQSQKDLIKQIQELLDEKADRASQELAIINGDKNKTQ